MATLKSLAEFCRRHGLAWDATVERRFEDYRALLLQFNDSRNLIGPLGPDEIERELFVDSAAAAAVCAPTGSILDIGSGAGLPGIPLKILFPELPLTIVEPRNKRTTFLRIVKQRLKLEDVTVHECRIEEVDLGPHGYVVSKAFRPPPEWLETAVPLVSADGAVVCLHASDATEELTVAAERLGSNRIAHVRDVASELAADVPRGRAVSVYSR